MLFRKIVFFSKFDRSQYNIRDMILREVSTPSDRSQFVPARYRALDLRSRLIRYRGCYDDGYVLTLHLIKSLRVDLT